MTQRETPPRAWGRLTLFLNVANVTRNTPTCMGKTHEYVVTGDISEKHPHVHGEDPVRGVRAGLLSETPPRAWGRPAKLYQDDAWRGNTPTCMGKTQKPNPHKYMQEKHPHVHGEDETNKRQRASKVETPPRAWGRLQRRCRGLF